MAYVVGLKNRTPSWNGYPPNKDESGVHWLIDIKKSKADKKNFFFVIGRWLHEENKWQLFGFDKAMTPEHLSKKLNYRYWGFAQPSDNFDHIINSETREMPLLIENKAKK